MLKLFIKNLKNISSCVRKARKKGRIIICLVLCFGFHEKIVHGNNVEHLCELHDCIFKKCRQRYSSYVYENKLFQNVSEFLYLFNISCLLLQSIIFFVCECKRNNNLASIFRINVASKYFLLFFGSSSL